MSHEEDVNAYLDTVKRMEPDITPVDHAGAIASIAISLKRIADALERSDHSLLADRIHDAIYNAIIGADRQRMR